jgi:hypothetical protein
MFGFGFVLFAHFAAERADQQPGQGRLLAVAAGLITGPAIFVVGQLGDRLDLQFRCPTPLS